MTPPPVAPDPAGGGNAPPSRPEWVKPVVMCVLLLLGVLVVYLSPLRHYLGHVREIKAQVLELGPAGPLVYMLAVFILVALGCPRLLICPLGGMIFGVAKGLLWTQLPTLLGYYVTFLFARWGGHSFTLRHWPGMARATGALRGRSWPAIFLLRQVPMPGVLSNLFLGVSPVRHRDFLLGSALGLLPQAIPATMVGKSLLHVSAVQAWSVLGGAVVLFLLFVLGLRRFADSIPWLHGLRDSLRALRR